MRLLVLITTLALIMGCAGDSSTSSTSPKTQLPYYGIHDLNENGDTLYYTIPKFSFTNQSGREVSHKDYEGKIFVTDFFFTTCPTICPIMSTQMSRLQHMLKEEGVMGDVMLLSHSVNPEHDQPDVLLEYADRIGADTTTWNLVTGPRKDIYDQAKNGYFINALESDTAAGGFIHSDNFMLIDREMHIRGYYDGTSTKDVDQLFEDILSLLDDGNGEE